MSLIVDDLKVYYRTLAGDVHALDGVTFTLAEIPSPVDQTARFVASMPPMATVVSGLLVTMRPMRSSPTVGSGLSLVGVGKTGPTPI